jgi:hypothetical protein
MSTVPRKPVAVNQLKSRNLTGLDPESKKPKDFNREINEIHEPGFRFFGIINARHILTFLPPAPGRAARPRRTTAEGLLGFLAWFGYLAVYRFSVIFQGLGAFRGKKARFLVGYQENINGS